MRSTYFALHTSAYLVLLKQTFHFLVGGEGGGEPKHNYISFFSFFSFPYSTKWPAEVN